MSEVVELSLDALRAIVGDQGVVTDPGDLEPYDIDWRHLFQSATKLAIATRIKRVLDPLGLLNPGKVLARNGEPVQP